MELPLGETSSIASYAIAGLKELWNETLGDPNVCVAVLDGPVELSHPSLVGVNLTQIETLASSGVDSGSALRHGTQITSIIFGQHNDSLLFRRDFQ